MSENLINDYLKEIHAVFTKGDAREESYYSRLENLIKSTANELNKRNIAVTTLPRKTEGGNPDFRVWDGKAKIVGYVETKKPKVDLDDVQESDQIKRYRAIFPNFILTNFLEFRLYRNGEFQDSAAIGRQHTLVKVGVKPATENVEKFKWLFELFLSFSFPRNLNARRLAGELAKRTRYLRDQIIAEELKEGENGGANKILGSFEAFRQYLIHGLSEREFADLYAQTITYGLFAARVRCQGEFHRRNAVEYIPRTIGILHDVFEFISLGKPPTQLEWAIDDIAEVLASVNVSVILNEFYQQGRGEDPIIHFYETFLSEYDPKTRERRGVYYTPAAVVSFIVRSLDAILKEKFHKGDGLADTGVKVLDPAAGTLTFIAEAAKLAFATFREKYGQGAKTKFIREHLLKNFYAFELMMAPYTVGHMKMAYVLEEMGYTLDPERDRFQLFLTNTLEMEDIEQVHIPGISTLADESRRAGKIKKDTPILVILGNPPYSGHSANLSEKSVMVVKNDKEVKRKIKTWIGEQIETYKYVDGKPLGEKNPKWLQDDYVKFIRFAQWKIDQNGEGVAGMITNHSYLNNPTFRGMRRSLMSSFNEIHILDLHGNSLKKERCPDGSKDENVFDIMQGVAISLFVKKRGEKGCKIFRSDLWGLQEDKYERLGEIDIGSITWKIIEPKPEFFLFVPQDKSLYAAYDKFKKITEVFPVNSVGIVTARDSLTIHWSADAAYRTALNFTKMDAEEARVVFDIGNDAKDWKVDWAQRDLNESGLKKENVTPILYRPFDIRFTYYTGKSSGFHCRPRPEVMRQMLKKNIALITARSNKSNKMDHFFCTNYIMETKCGESTTQSCLIPLYLYDDSENKNLFVDVESIRESPKKNRQANIDPKIFELFVRAGLKPAPTPEQIFYYIYAVLYSNIYRKKYAEFLKTDFPRIPFTTNKKLFYKMAELGEELADIHLLKSPFLNKTFSKFEGPGNNSIVKVVYAPLGAGSTRQEGEGKVFINDTQYFSNISSDIWEYQIGGYQVMTKWLKDRKGRALSLDDIRHYIRVARAIELTIFYQQKIDELFPEVEKKLHDKK